MIGDSLRDWLWLCTKLAIHATVLQQVAVLLVERHARLTHPYADQRSNNLLILVWLLRILSPFDLASMTPVDTDRAAI